MENAEEEYENWDVLIWKALAVEEKSRRRPTLQIKKVDQYCSKGHCCKSRSTSKLLAGLL